MQSNSGHTILVASPRSGTSAAKSTQIYIAHWVVKDGFMFLEEIRCLSKIYCIMVDKEETLSFIL
jgi:hypothetical protein